MAGFGYLPGSSNGCSAVLEEFDDSSLQIKGALSSQAAWRWNLERNPRVWIMGGANDTGGGEIRPSQPGLFQHPQEL